MIVRSKTSRAVRAAGATVLALWTVDLCAQPGRFRPGHIYISEIEPETCFNGHPRTYVREIDPDTGQTWRIIDSSPGLCEIVGLSFTPDGRGLRLADYDPDRVWEFDSNGVGRIVYEYKDGLRGPYVGMTFDRAGNFYVVNESNVRILKFLNDAPPGVLFAGSSSGLSYDTSLALSPGGDIFCASRTDSILRFKPNGQWVVFDTFSDVAQIESLAFDKQGNLYVAVARTILHIYRYDNADATARYEIGTHDYSIAVIALSPDDRTVYVADRADRVFGIDVETGASREILGQTAPVWGGFGIAVYDPRPFPGDLNCDGTLNQFDIQPFITALTSAEVYAASYPECDRVLADVNGDGTVNPFDIQRFVQRLETP